MASGLIFETANGRDLLTLDFSGGDIVPAGDISFHGGDPATEPGDQLVIIGGDQGTVVYDFVSAHDGSITMSPYGTVSYTGLEPITNYGAATDVIFNLPPGANAAFLEDDGTPGNGLSRLRGDPATFETVVFANPAGTVTINPGSADDTLTVNELPDLAAGLTFGAAPARLASVTVAGAVTLAPGKGVSAFAATVAIDGPVTTLGGDVHLSASEHVTLNDWVATGDGTFSVQADSDGDGVGAFHMTPAAFGRPGGSVAAAGGTVNITAADVHLEGPVSTTAAASFVPSRDGQPIDLGTDTAGIFSLTGVELTRVTAPAIHVGDTATGGIVVSGPINRFAATDLLLTAGNAGIAFVGGSLNAGGGNVTLATGVGGAVTADGSGADITANHLAITAGAAGGAGIGSTANPLRLAVASLATNTAGADGDQYLVEADSAAVAGPGLAAGDGEIHLLGGAFLTTPGGSILSQTVVASGATLGGNGQVTGAVTVNAGGTLTGGTVGTVGTLTIASLAFNGGTYQADVAGDTGDTIRAIGTVDLAAPQPGLFQLNASGRPSDFHVFRLLDTDGSTPLSDAPLGGAPEGGTVWIGGRGCTYTYQNRLPGAAGDFTARRQPGTHRPDSAFGPDSRKLADADAGRQFGRDGSRRQRRALVHTRWG